MANQLIRTSGIGEDLPPSLDSGIESDFIAGLQNGDNQVIQEIFYAYFDRLFSFVFHEVGRDPAVAEDIVQETFIGALKSARTFNGKSRIYTWLASIAHHKIADHYRQVKRRGNSTSMDNLDSIPAEIIEQNGAVVNFVESTEDKFIVEQALKDLPPDYRQTLILKYVEELPVAEISQIMNRSPKSVEGILTRARKLLRNNLKEERPEGK